jgi:hypothetical protein
MKWRTSHLRLSAARALASALLLTLPLPMWATLGDNAASVLTDQARMKGTVRSVDNQTYVMHEITATSGAKVREFVTPGGAVFGVAWEGQQPPDLQQLLGPYYQQARQARQAQLQDQNASQNAPRAHRAPVAIQTPGLVLYEGGHVRSFHGAAYIPQLIPPGVQASDIR